MAVRKVRGVLGTVGAGRARDVPARGDVTFSVSVSLASQSRVTTPRIGVFMDYHCDGSVGSTRSRCSSHIHLGQHFISVTEP